jgi:uncharacterized membrane protein
MDTTGRRYSLKIGAVPTDDLMGLVLLTLLLLVGIVWLHDASWFAPIRFLLGSLYVLYLPGYCLTAALFPSPADLDPIERVGLNCGFSVALIPLIAWVLDQLSLGLHVGVLVLAEYLLMGGCLVIALVRRALLATPDALPPPSGQTTGWWQRLAHPTKVAWIGLLGIVVVAGGLLRWPPVATTGYTTEFYMMGVPGRAELFPQSATVNQPVTVWGGIRNEADAERAYHVEIWVSEPYGTGTRYRAASTEAITLAPGEQWQAPLTWTLSRSGADQQIEILLFAEGQLSPYRRLQFWMHGVAEGEATP